MHFEIDFNSDEAIYIQLRNQIILQIANETLKDGVSLPSVRQLADSLGVNMHTVNKAYTILKQDGYLKLDRRKGAVVCVEIADKSVHAEEMCKDFKIMVAQAKCKNISLEEIHYMIEKVYHDLMDS
ncbi:MAG: GntR family transcriptional regulator [Lachnospiraceae bacterium]|nr:GntR family transcriptional regulator [Lachnospiraceae bacterium]